MSIKIILDCEFTDFTQPKLISLGLVTEDNNHSFYAELTDTYSIDDCSEFVISTVLPLLDSKPISQNLDYFKHVHAQMTFSQCQLNLMKWFDGIEGNMSIHNDMPHFDFSLLSSFFIEKWPDRLSLFCETIGATTIVGQESYDRTMRDLFKNGYRQHHSLDDAKVMLMSYQEMEIAEAVSSQYIMGVGITHLINSKKSK